MKPEIYREEGYKFMGAAFEVYNDRGYGMAEEIYQECLEIELELRAFPFHSKQELVSFYKGRELKKALPARPVRIWLPRRGTKGRHSTHSRPRGSTLQLPPPHASARRVPHQLRTQGRPRMEAFHPLRVHSVISAD